ncbi:penicillin-binding Protein dimerization domain protein [Paraburkholderia fungorum]|uniref:Penicillin-binding Protein dimerization domain protein n=1 Tax=Paraburkholderia fungorum TaxID=134537 RepID=A0AAP5UXX0_9BURK|nr:hypothetical protein [Paraburkholderia fungorum]AJZ56549.1 penicillin-binding Protein dimerization domain protein [Paraburkholderia fungorum]MDT8843450.1 hypothetical protein [Paraburkholderia fungorum]
MRDLTIHASRGRILGRDGYPLALSLPTRILWVDASDKNDRVWAQQAGALAKLLAIEQSDVEQIFAQHRGFAYLKRQVSVETADRVMQMNVPGIFAQQDYRS